MNTYVITRDVDIVVAAGSSGLSGSFVGIETTSGTIQRTVSGTTSDILQTLLHPLQVFCWVLVPS